MTHRPIALLCLFTSFAAAGCVTDSAVEPVGSTTETEASVAHQAEYGRTLQLLDQHVTKYVFLKSQGGESAKRERYVERAASVSLVRPFQDRLIATARDSSDLGRQRIAAVALAFSSEPEAVTALTSILDRRGDARLMVNATFALAELRSPSTLAQPLIDLLSHPDPDVRNNTLLALRNSMEARRVTGAAALLPLQRAEALPLIEAALFEPDDPQIRGHAAACLGTLRDPNSVDVLINLLPDPDLFVRTRTAVALAHIGDKRAIVPLIAVIDETPAGIPLDAVTTALEVIVERSGRTVPPYIEQTERAWKSFIKERLGPEDL